MGVELVEGRDLVCAGNQVSMRTTDGQQRVDVIYRRIDDEFLDPVHFRPDSVIGCAGVLNAARAGRVTIANAVGNGVADDKLLYTWVPDLIRYYLGEEPVLANADTYRLDERDTVEWVLESLDQLVLKPVDGSGGKGIVIGPQADEKTLARARGQGAGHAAGLDRAEADRAVHLPDADRRPDRAAARRPAAVRGQRRRQGVGAARRADPGRAARGRAGGQLQPGRRLQGHLGAQPAAAGQRTPEEPDLTRIEFTAADLPEDPPAQDPGPLNDTVVGQSQQQQQGPFGKGTRGTTC